MISKLLVTGLLALGLSAPATLAAQSQHSAAENSQSSEQGNHSAKKFDQTDFVKKAAEGNQAEIQLADLALQKTNNPDTRNLAQTIKNDHQEAQKKLQSVAEQLSIKVPDEPSEHAQTEKDTLSKLSGQQFDKAYAQHMVNEHRKDINEFRQAKQSAMSPQVQDFAQNTLPTLQKHLKMAQKSMTQLGGTTQQAQQY